MKKKKMEKIARMIMVDMRQSIPTTKELEALVMTMMVEFPLDQEQTALGYNGGIKCDNPHGPCACGAWHKTSNDATING